MIAGRFDPRRPPGPLRAIAQGAEHRADGPLRLAWSATVAAVESDGLLVLLDGHTSRGDARSVHRGWRRDGPETVAALRGSFTVVVWDRRTQAGAVLCDHHTLRACYRHAEGSELRFSTALPVLRRLLGATPPPDAEVLVSWIAPRHHRGHATLLQGVERVGAARMLEFDGEGWRRRRYWRAVHRPPLEVGAAEAAGLLRTGLDRAVGARVDAGGRTGTILSGGIDSSVVVASAVRLGHGPAMPTYSTAFPRWKGADEEFRIVATTRALGLANHRFEVAPRGALRLAARYVLDSGLPAPGPGILVERALLERAAADGVTDVLDGQGGDELFLASLPLLADALRRGDLSRVRRLVRRHPAVGRRPPLRAIARLVFERGLLPLTPEGPRNRLVGRHADAAPAHLDAAGRRTFARGEDPYPWLHDRRGPYWWAALEHVVGDGREGTGLGDYAWHRGRALGLRSRLPLFDVDLTELMLRLPPELSWSRLNRPLARATAADRLPPEILLQRRKANIGAFYLDLMLGPDGAAMRALLGDREARIRAYCDSAGLQAELARAPRLGDPDALRWATVLWRSATAELWLRWLEDPASVEELAARFPGGQAHLRS